MASDLPPIPPGQSVETWVRETTFELPISWGALEKAILSQPLDHPPVVVRGGPSVWIVKVLAELMHAIPVIGLVLVAAMGLEVIAPRGGALVAAELLFLASAVLPFTAVNIWNFDGRLRSWPTLVRLATSGLASTVSLVVAASSTWSEDSGRLQWICVAAALTGFGTCLYLALASRGWRQRTPRDLRPHTDEDLIRNDQRAEALHTLIETGVISSREIATPDMLEMPIGSWHTLD